MSAPRCDPPTSAGRAGRADHLHPPIVVVVVELVDVEVEVVGGGKLVSTAPMSHTDVPLLSPSFGRVIPR
jgi:hypothetical protein